MLVGLMLLNTLDGRVGDYQQKQNGNMPQEVDSKVKLIVGEMIKT